MNVEKIAMTDDLGSREEIESSFTSQAKKSRKKKAMERGEHAT